MLKYLPRPRNSFVQWHITERCNLRCKHCYQDSYNTPQLEWEKMEDIVYQYLELLDFWGIRGRIQITGGEPFIREKELFKLLELCYQNKHKLDYTIMSNGFFITKEIAKRLKEIELGSFQVSIEGDEKENDEIRGKGSYKRIIEAARILVQEGVRVAISFTSSKANFRSFPKLVEAGKKIGVNVVWTDRLVPCGSGAGMMQDMLAPLELKEHYEEISKISKKLIEEKSKTHVPRGRALYFLADKELWHNNKQYSCDVVGTRGMTIMPDGIVYPCRRMPAKVGDLKKDSLFEIWYGSDLMWELRDKNSYKNEICGKCEFFEKCTTGSMCVTHGYCENCFAPDPQCWKAFEKLPSERELKSLIGKNDEKPNFWENIIVPEVKNSLGEYFIKENGNLFFIDKNNEKIRIKKSINKVIEHNNLLLEIDEVDFENIFNEMNNKKIDNLFLSFKFKEEDINKETKNKIIEFFNKLKDNKINYKLIEPLPKSLFGASYFNIARKFNIPFSWKDACGLFYIEDEHYYFPSLDKKGPLVKYLPSREQVWEYFSILNGKK